MKEKLSKLDAEIIEISCVNFDVENYVNIGLYPLIKNKSLNFDWEGTKTSEFLLIKMFQLIFQKLILNNQIEIKFDSVNIKLPFIKPHIDYYVKVSEKSDNKDLLSDEIQKIIILENEIELEFLVESIIKKYLKNSYFENPILEFIQRNLKAYVYEFDWLKKNENLSSWKRMLNKVEITVVNEKIAEYSMKIAECEKDFFLIQKQYEQYNSFNLELERLIKKRFNKRDNS